MNKSRGFRNCQCIIRLVSATGERLDLLNEFNFGFKQRMHGKIFSEALKGREVSNLSNFGNCESVPRLNHFFEQLPFVAVRDVGVSAAERSSSDARRNCEVDATSIGLTVDAS